jgi:hypothetical protein
MEINPGDQAAAMVSRAAEDLMAAREDSMQVVEGLMADRESLKAAERDAER